jgi:hypothetical protein
MQRMTVLAPLDREGRKTFWLRIGRAFHNKDGSINVYLDALPVGGKLQIREDADRNSGADVDAGDAGPPDEGGDR